MNFEEAEKIYRDLKQQHAAGKLSDTDFEAEVAKLRHQDAQGRWWQLGVQTGEWYMHDGQKWNKAKPPPTPAAPAVEPVAVPEGSAAQKPRLASVLPARLFSAAPAGRGDGKGLPTSLLIVIIAVVALIAVAVLVGGYFLISGQLGSTARATVTPTRALAVLSSPVIPTITLARPTDAPPTIALTATVAANTPAAPKATATKKPATPPTPAGPAATATPNVPPGVYVTKVETDPAKPDTDPTHLVGFKVTFFNSTGSMQSYSKWFMRVFQCPEQCIGDNGFKNSYGESLKFDVNIATGSNVITTPPHVNFGPGRCEYIAIPYYTDGNQQAVQFSKIGGGGLYYAFRVCQ